MTTETLNEYVCEVCDKVDNLTAADAYASGWDYPPFMGAWNIVSPRTCPTCNNQNTVWWALAVDGTAPEALTETQLETVLRIVNEVPHPE